MAEQIILTADRDYSELDRYLQEHAVRGIFLVCDNAISFLRLNAYFEQLPERMGAVSYTHLTLPTT